MSGLDGCVNSRIKGIIDDMVRLKMIMYIDQDYNLCFLPGDRIEAMPTIRQQKYIADLGKQRWSQGRCFSLIC